MATIAKRDEAARRIGAAVALAKRQAGPAGFDAFDLGAEVAGLLCSDASGGPPAEHLIAVDRDELAMLVAAVEIAFDDVNAVPTEAQPAVDRLWNVFHQPPKKGG